MIELRNVSKIYSQNNKILDNINLCIGNSGMIAITGKNGCGKTTLLNIIGGVDTCTNGSIYIDNHKLEHQNIDDYRKNYVSFIFQDYNLINELNVYENIILCLKINNLKVNENDIDELLDKLKLNNLKLRKVNQLSSGQKQRVAIARALVKKPKIILADEPTCNLDYKNANNIMELLKNISNEIPVLIVTHDDNIINYADKIIELKDKTIKHDSIIIAENNNHDEIYNKNNKKINFKTKLFISRKLLLYKPYRLIPPVLMISFSIIFLLLSLTIKNYSIVNDSIKNNIKYNIKLYEIKKYKLNTNSKELVMLNKTDKKEFTNDNLNLYNVYNLNENNSIVKFFKINMDDPFELIRIKKDLYTFFPNTIDIVECDTNEIKEEIIGNYPNNNNEILISNYLVDYFIKNGVSLYDSTEVFVPKNYNDMLNKKIYFGDNNYAIISGIIKYNLSDFEELKNIYQNSPKNNQDHLFYKSYILNSLVNNLYNKIFVNSSFISSLNKPFLTNLDNKNIYSIKLNDKSINYKPSLLNEEIEYFNGKEWVTTNELNDNEAIISTAFLYELINNDKNYYDKISSYLESTGKNDVSEGEKNFFLENYYSNKLIGNNIELSINNKLINKDIKIIGVTSSYIYTNDFNVYISNNVIMPYQEKYSTLKSFVFFEKDIKKRKDLLKKYDLDNTYNIRSIFTDDLESIYIIVKRFNNFTNVCAIIFTILSLLIIINYTMDSYSKKKNTIGILMSLGINKKEINMILLFESIILSVFTILFSSILYYFISEYILKFYFNFGHLVSNPFNLTLYNIIIISIFTFISFFISFTIIMKKNNKSNITDIIYNR